MEVLPFAHAFVSIRLKSMFPESRCVLRQAVRKAGPIVTDNGNFIIDFDLGHPIDQVPDLEKQLCTIPGILESGLFHGIANEIFISHLHGSISHLKFNKIIT